MPARMCRPHGKVGVCPGRCLLRQTLEPARLPPTSGLPSKRPRPRLLARVQRLRASESRSPARRSQVSGRFHACPAESLKTRSRERVPQRISHIKMLLQRGLLKARHSDDLHGIGSQRSSRQRRRRRPRPGSQRAQGRASALPPQIARHGYSAHYGDPHRPRQSGCRGPRSQKQKDLRARVR